MPKIPADNFDTLYASLNSALDATGIGRDYYEKLGPTLETITAFCADLQTRAIKQAVYNALHNVPCGILKPDECTPTAALRSAVAGAIGAFVKWDIADALDFAADIAEDVNDTESAAAIRKMTLA